MKKSIQYSVFALVLLLGLSFQSWSQEFYNEDDYAYEEEYDDDYDSFFDNDEYDITEYNTADIGELVYNPVTGRMQRSYYYLGRTLYLLDMQTGGYYPVRNRYRASIGYPDRFYYDPFWSRTPGFTINFNFGNNYGRGYSYWNRFPGRFYSTYYGNNWGLALGFGFGWNNARRFYNPYLGYNYPSRYYGSRFNRYRWWGWGPGGWNVRNSNRSNLVNISTRNVNRNIRLNYPQQRNNSQYTNDSRYTNTRRSTPRSADIVNTRRGNRFSDDSPNRVETRSTQSGRSVPSAPIERTRSTRSSSEIIQSRRKNTAESPSRGQTSRTSRGSFESPGYGNRFSRPQQTPSVRQSSEPSRRESSPGISRSKSRENSNPGKRNSNPYTRESPKKQESRRSYQSDSRNSSRSSSQSRPSGSRSDSNQSSRQRSYSSRDRVQSRSSNQASRGSSSSGRNKSKQNHSKSRYNRI